MRDQGHPLLWEFMTADQQRRYAGDGHDADHARQQVAAAMPNPRGRGRPRREWRSSQAQLENIANGEPSPPDENDAKHDESTAFSIEDAYVSRIF